MDQYENDKPYSNDSYNNDCGEEINNIPSNESSEEINNCELISKRSKKIAKAITSGVVALAIIALFAPMFTRACNKIRGIDFSKLFVCEVIASAVYDTSIECDIAFSRLDEKTGEKIEGDINLEEYGEDITLILSSESEKFEKIITTKIKDNVYKAKFVGLKEDTEYMLSIKIGDDLILETKFTTNEKQQN